MMNQCTCQEAQALARNENTTPPQTQPCCPTCYAACVPSSPGNRTYQESGKKPLFRFLDPKTCILDDIVQSWSKLPEDVRRDFEDKDSKEQEAMYSKRLPDFSFTKSSSSAGADTLALGLSLDSMSLGNGAGSMKKVRPTDNATTPTTTK